MKDAIHIIRSCAETLLGEDNKYINTLTHYLSPESIPQTPEQYTLLEESTLCILSIISTWCYFEQKHSSLWNTPYYKQYSISHICNQYPQGLLWNILYTRYEEASQRRIIPLYSHRFVTPSVRTMLSTYTIPDDTLISYIRHIESTLLAYPILCSMDIGHLYEIYREYSLTVQDNTLIWRHNNVHKKYTGSYYTPDTIAQEIARYAYEHILNTIPIEEHKIIDISCGTGNILLHIVEYFAMYYPLPEDVLSSYIATLSTDTKGIWSNEDIRIRYKRRYCIEYMLYGIDINPIALGIFHYCLQYISFIEGIACAPLHHIRCGNALMNISYAHVETILYDRRQELHALYTAYRRTYTENPAELYASLHELYTSALNLHLAMLTNIPIDAFYESTTCIHYELAFPEVFFEAPYGFTFGIGNPPWEKTKFEETLLLEQYHKGYTQENEHTKRNIRNHIQEEYKNYSTYIKEYITQQSACYSSLFPKSKGIGDSNLYRYFIEQMLTSKYGTTLLCKHGYLLYIIPTAFLTEESSTQLRTYIMQTCTIHYAVGFENRNAIFPFIDSRYQFSIICIQHTPPTTEELRIGSRQIFAHPLCEYTQISIKYRDIALFSKGSYAIPELRSSHDSVLLGAIYTLFEPLSESYITVRRELDCASNRDLFYPESSSFADIPLYQGAMIWQYNSVYAPPKHYVASSMLDTLLQSRELYRLYNDIYQCLPIDYKRKYRHLRKADAVCAFIGMSRADMLLHYIPERTLPRFAIRAIARNSDERSVICSLLPYNVTYQNSLFGSVAKRYVLTESHTIQCLPTPIERQLYSISIFNSLVYDWCMRFISAINISKAYIHKIPFPQPNDIELQQLHYRKLIDNTFSLERFHNPSLCALPIKSQRVIHSHEEARQVQIENDCLVGELYGLGKEDMEHITSKTYFAVLHKKKKSYIEHLLDVYAP